MSILNVEHLTHGFGDRAIFEDVSFRLLKGEHIGLVGANGEGKSTFMSIVTGKLMPDEGKVEWAKNVHAGYLDQHAVLEKGMTIGQVLKSAFDPLLKKEERMNEICLRHHVVVVSDEIHNELVMPGYSYTPFASVSEACLDNSITLTSPSKSFNIAGLQMANIVTKNAEWRRRIERVVNIFEICDVNPFAPVAIQAAYNESEDWIDALNLYIHDNFEVLRSFCREHLPKWQVMHSEGTYLAWVDISQTGLSAESLAQEIMERAHVKVNSGTLYGSISGEGYLRINLACPRSLLEEALRRIGEHF